jgi:hypothetical protein
MVDRSDRLALVPPMVSPRLQSANVQVIFAFRSDPWHQQLELQYIGIETAFVRVLQHKRPHGLSKVRECLTP